MDKPRIAFDSYAEILPLKKLKKSKHQRNKHPQEQIERLAKIMKEHGVRHPIHISKLSNEVCFGHGRWQAAKLNGWTEFPVVYQEFKDDDEEYACVQSDNAIAHWAELDLSAINTDLANLGPDFDIDLLGIKDFVLEPAEKFEAQSDEDEVPENVDTRCKLGDVWTLGRHRLMCGNSTSATDYEQLMQGESVDICFTSPPYNAGETPGEKGKYLNDSDDKSQEDFLELLTGFTSLALTYSDFAFVNIQSLSGNKTALIDYLYRLKSNYADTIVWDKLHAQPAMANNVLNSRYEYIHIFSNKANRSIGTKVFRGTHDNVFSMSSKKDKDYASIHKATFPIGFVQHFIENFSDKSVLEPFGGSGTTLIACEKTNRKCFVMELDPHYCDVILSRWEKYTGKEAKRVGDETGEESGRTTIKRDRRKASKKSSRN